jgi:hypothetical protein
MRDRPVSFRASEHPSEPRAVSGGTVAEGFAAWAAARADETFADDLERVGAADEPVLLESLWPDG